MVHRNAPLSETGRLRLARCIVDEGWTLRLAAERFQVSVRPASRLSLIHISEPTSLLSISYAVF